MNLEQKLKVAQLPKLKQLLFLERLAKEKSLQPSNNQPEVLPQSEPKMETKSEEPLV